VTDRFRGEFSQKVDSKARVSIPAAFRRVLEGGDPMWREASRLRMVMVYGGSHRSFVECYPIVEMRALEDMIVRLPRGTARRRILEHNFITLSQVVDVDDDGRIVLPAKVRDKLGIDAAGGEAVFAGTLETFQLWRADTYEADSAAYAGLEAAELAEGADMLSLLLAPNAEPDARTM
jgi:MraZ protein